MAVQLSDDERHLFEQLGRNPVFQKWIERELEAEMKTLKANTKLEFLYNAQGAVRVLETLQGHLRLSTRA